MGGGMTNIPTDLLRTLVAVVDLRSFTKAAASLGVTQPAVSAQIKRLQFLLGGDLFDRSIQGVSLTPQGELVVSYARRLLSINEQIVHIGDSGPRPELVIRVGTPSEYIASILPGILAQFRERRPDVRFIIRTDVYDPLVRQLRDGDIDLMVGLSMVSYGELCVYHRLAVQALQSVGLDWEDVFTGPSTISLSSAIDAGLGVMAITRRRAEKAGMLVWEDPPLPKLPDLYSGIYVREGGARAIYEQLADDIAAVFYDPAESPPELHAGAATVRKANTA